MKKRILSAFLAVTILAVSLFATACSPNEVPSGMQIAYRNDAPYKLFVPKGWKVDISSETVSTYSSNNDPLSVTVTVADAPEGKTLDEYWQSYGDTFADTFDDFNITSADSAILDGAAAMKYVYSGTLIAASDKTENSAPSADATATAEKPGNHYTFTQYLTAKGEKLLIITFSCASSTYEGHKENIEKIMAEFKFNDASDVSPETPSQNGAAVIDGMKYISNDVVDYDFYVPDSWTHDMSSGALSAYDPSDKTSVTAAAWDVSYMEGMLDKWKENYIDDISMISDDFAVTSEEETTLDGATALKLTSSATVAGKEYKYVSVAAIRNYMVYVITYTAEEQYFDMHLDDLDAVIEAFSFRK